MKKKIPEFKNEKQEAKFWQKNDSTDFIDWPRAKKDVEISNLKPSTKTTTLRPSGSTLDNLKVADNKKDIPW